MQLSWKGRVGKASLVKLDLFSLDRLLKLILFVELVVINLVRLENPELLPQPCFFSICRLSQTPP